MKRCCHPSKPHDGVMVWGRDRGIHKGDAAAHALAERGVVIEDVLLREVSFPNVITQPIEGT